MKIIYKKHFPFRGFKAIMLFGRIYARKEFEPLSETDTHHEEIHLAQAKEMKGCIPYYIVYLYWHIRRGYDNNPFEREAYDNEINPDYLTSREPFAWRIYLK